MKIGWRVLLSTLVVLSGLALAQKEIVFGWSGAVTGPTAEVGQVIIQAVEDYCQYANDENLIPGYTVRCLTRDDQYNNDNTLRNFESYLDDGMVAFISYSTGGTLQLKVNAEEEGIPVLSASYHVGIIDAPDNDYNFLPITTYSEQVLALLEWIANNNQGGTPKVAIFSHPSPFGRAPVADAEKAADLLGLDIVEVQESSGDLDYTAMLQRWASEGVQYVISQNVQSPVAAMLKAAQALGLMDSMTFMGAHYTGGTTLTSLAGDAAEGYLWSTSYYLESEKLPGMELQRQIGERYGRSEDTINEVNYTTGLLQAAIYVEAARRAAEKGDVTSDTLYQALLDMHDGADGAFDPGFGVGPVSFGPHDRIGIDAMRLIQVQQGAWVPITAPTNSSTFQQVHPLQ